jgi:hypothetical protein
MIPVHRGAMTRGQERADDVPRGVEGQRVRAELRGNGLVTPERSRVEHLDDTGVADRHVEAAQGGIVEHDVGDPGDRLRTEDRTAVGIDLEQDPGVAGTEQSTPGNIDIQAVGAGVGNRGDASDGDRIAGLDDDDLWRIRNVDMKRIRDGIVDGPPRSARHGDVGDPLRAWASTIDTVVEAGMAGSPT